MNLLSAMVDIYLERIIGKRSSLYMDTNGWSSLAKGDIPVTPLKEWLGRRTNLIIVISRYQVSELIKDTGLLEGLVDVVAQLPVIFIDRKRNELNGEPWYLVGVEEIEPMKNSGVDSKNALSDMLRDGSLNNVMSNQTVDDVEMWQRAIISLLAEVSVSRNGSWSDFPRFMATWIRIILENNGKAVNEEYLNDPKRYIGLRLSAGVMYSRYYISQNDYSRLDIHDILQSCDMPYSYVAIAEASLMDDVRHTVTRLPRNGPDHIYTLDWLRSPYIQ